MDVAAQKEHKTVADIVAIRELSKRLTHSMNQKNEYFRPFKDVFRLETIILKTKNGFCRAKGTLKQ